MEEQQNPLTCEIIKAAVAGEKRTMDIYAASAFSKDGKGGNKAGVVIGEFDLTYNQKG